MCSHVLSRKMRWGFSSSQRKAEDLGISFIETSAKEAINVDLVRVFPAKIIKCGTLRFVGLLA